MRRRTLYLPIEIKYRELLGKTLLAAKAVDRGWRVYMGGVDLHDHMATGFPPGLLIENNIPDTKATRLGQLKTKGYRIADLCEESIIYPDAQDYVARKIGLRSLPATDVILATGARSQRDICALRKDAARKLVVTGNPRFDTLMPSVRVVYEDEARKIRDRYGRFLFVTTNFSSANPFKTGLDVVAVLQRDGKLATPEQADLKRRQVAYKARHMKGMQTLLIEVARTGAFDSIVLRPHPSENYETWQAWASDPGVEIQYQGSANVWMLAADMVLHPGCTTGIEALLLDRWVASYVPEPEGEFVNQADRVSVNVGSADELLTLVKKQQRGDDEQVTKHLAAGRESLRDCIDNVEPPLAADRILDVVDKMDVPETEPSWFARWPLCGPMMHVKAWTSRREASKKARKGYRHQKFPGLGAEDVRTPLARWLEAGLIERMPDIAPVDHSILRLQ